MQRFYLMSTPVRAKGVHKESAIEHAASLMEGVQVLDEKLTVTHD
jgi:hypothetical protein